MKKDISLSFAHWKQLVRDSFRAFPSLWWRISAVNVLTVLTLVAGTGVFLCIGYFFFWDDVRNFLVNFNFGGAWTLFVPVLILLILWAIFVLIFSLNGKASSWITVRNHVNKKHRNPFTIYYRESWGYLGRYVSLILKSLWYIFWPVAIVAGIMFLAESFFPTFKYLEWGLDIAIVGAIFLIIWRSLQLIFVREVLIHFNSTSQKTFKLMLKLARGNISGIFLFSASFFILISLVRIPFLVLSGMNLISSQQVLDIMGLADFLFSFFVLAPLLVTFLYFFMLFLSQSKQLKP